ncbi:hypothetical protein NUZ5A_20300 [Candidatus Nitrosotenuis uzonensis]|uniref:Uncharacterized protein n=1 Tax=Candidatus Nitrosotenuis uzonensis TaxID=1407055 RepID=A0A812EZL3_9ARCH|nr:hypothetical protein NUZ5A_20300 [Candidatus Nitrosotenuis uzonensis]
MVALLVSLSAVGIAVIKFKKESKVRIQKDLVSALTGIIDSTQRHDNGIPRDAKYRCHHG